MIRVRGAKEFGMFSVGCFILGSVQLRQFFTVYGANRQITNRISSSQKFSTSSEAQGGLDPTLSSPDQKRKKSPLYTKTGDKGSSSVSCNDIVTFFLYLIVSVVVSMYHFLAI